MSGTLRRECLDHIIPLDEEHLHAVLAEYATYYNRDRPHRTLHLETPGRASARVHDDGSRPRTPPRVGRSGRGR